MEVFIEIKILIKFFNLGIYIYQRVLIINLKINKSDTDAIIIYTRNISISRLHERNIFKIQIESVNESIGCFHSL